MKTAQLGSAGPRVARIRARLHMGMSGMYGPSGIGTKASLRSTPLWIPA